MILARLSFNTNNWEKPSGSFGKSKNINTHECEFGFGFEEWLCNLNAYLNDKNNVKLHFGYIEGIHKNYIVTDEEQPLTLFTINAITKERFIVGIIKDWQYVTPDESTQIVNQNPILIKEMRNDVIVATDNRLLAVVKFNHHVNNHNGFQLFNIKYRNIEFCYDKNKPEKENHVIYKLNRFWLYKNIKK
jgi:hypothetical protein